MGCLLSRLLGLRLQSSLHLLRGLDILVEELTSALIRYLYICGLLAEYRLDFGEDCHFCSACYVFHGCFVMTRPALAVRIGLFWYSFSIREQGFSTQPRAPLKGARTLRFSAHAPGRLPSL